MDVREARLKKETKQFLDIRHPQKNTTSAKEPTTPFFTDTEIPAAEEELFSYETPVEEKVSEVVVIEEAILNATAVPQWRLIASFVSLSVVVLGLFIGVSLLLPSRAMEDIVATSEAFETARSQLQDLNFNKTSETRLISEAELQASANFPIIDLLKKRGLKDTWAVVQNGGDIFKSFEETVSHYLDLSKETRALYAVTPQVLFNQSAGGLLPRLEKIQTHLDALKSENTKFTESLALAKDVLPINFGDYLALGADLNRLTDYSESLLSWLKAPSGRRVAVIFEDTSELRPTGGAWKIYGEAMLKDGLVTDWIVRDMTEADRALTHKIIPPRPLQGVATSLKAADANWLFDFSDSAEVGLRTLEKSGLYETTNKKFDLLIALTPRILEDLLSVIGGVELENRKLTVTRENIAAVIQSEMAKARTAATNNQKHIIQEIGEMAMKKVESLNEDQKLVLARSLLEWVKQKDVQLYARDGNLEAAIEFMGAGGGVFPIAPTADTGYLAVVQANVGGENTDRMMRQKVSLESRIEDSGNVVNHLVIDRAHLGSLSDEYIYRAPNKTYARILLPPLAELVSIQGVAEKRIPKKSFSSEFTADSLIEKSDSLLQEILGFPYVYASEESGKKVISFWTETARGKKTTVSLDYNHRLPQLPKDGSTYQFVFEKQAGVEGEYHFQLSAPAGFQFKENHLPIFEYHSLNPPARLIVNLTLEKN